MHYAIKQFIIIICCILFNSCYSSIEEEIINNQTAWISPDKNAIIYQIYSAYDNVKQIQLITHVKVGSSKGGGEIFTIRNIKETDTLRVIWKSESLAVIYYPITAKIVSQQSKTFFCGRTIFLKYLPNGF